MHFDAMPTTDASVDWDEVANRYPDIFSPRSAGVERAATPEERTWATRLAFLSRMHRRKHKVRNMCLCATHHPRDGKTEPPAHVWGCRRAGTTMSGKWSPGEAVSRTRMSHMSHGRA